MTDIGPLRAVLEEGGRRGFLGPGPVQPHLVHAQGFADVLSVVLPTVRSTAGRGLAAGEDSLETNRYQVCDLGSGAGLPGLPLLTWRQDLLVTLVDAQERRTRFLMEAVARLGLVERAQVVTGRIEELLGDPELALRGRFDAVVARSFGPPSATVEIAAHLIRSSGWVLISEPPKGRQWAAEGVAALGLVQRRVASTNLAVFERVGEPPPLRRWKAMTARPAVDVRP